MDVRSAWIALGALLGLVLSGHGIIRVSAPWLVQDQPATMASTPRVLANPLSGQLPTELLSARRSIDDAPPALQDSELVRTSFLAPPAGATSVAPSNLKLTLSNDVELQRQSDSSPPRYLTNSREVFLQGDVHEDFFPSGSSPSFQLEVQTASGVKPYTPIEVADTDTTKDRFKLKLDLPEGDTSFSVRVVKNDGSDPPSGSGYSGTVHVSIRQGPPQLGSVVPLNFDQAQGPYFLELRFDPNHILSSATVKTLANYKVIPGNLAPDEVEFFSASNMIRLKYNSLPPNQYDLQIQGALDGITAPAETTPLKDIFGNFFVGTSGNAEAKFLHRGLVKPIGSAPATQRPGITALSGNMIEFPEYTQPRKYPPGFNPSDHVETRIVRLYYYRDAHRVAQIINRETRSYNRAAVDISRQLAEKQQKEAESRTDERRFTEQQAIQVAEKTRRAETELATVNRDLESQRTLLNQTVEQVRQLQDKGAVEKGSKPIDKQLDAAVTSLTSIKAVITQNEQAASMARQKVESLRDQESTANGQVQRAEALEQRAKEEQFRREVAAAHEDPDTYAEGNPKSDDPVAQVSISVIGEAVIQLRGPVKGLNIVRKMINEIDSPAAQVRVAIHTAQINGEHGDRMEVVADKIQKYIDHSRFLTTQSAEMLRKAVVQVAGQRAMEVGNLHPAGTQDDRDQRYLYAFFGRDFIDELHSMDSEFLRSGNKLLSLHSMDTTSLSSALFLMSLAKNSTRQQILETFEAMTRGELPMSEQNYLEAGWSGSKGRRCGCRQPCRGCRDCFLMFAQNARFESFRGFYNGQVGEDDVMTPLQREFIRLAQIFKSRLIVERELKQRVIERAVIEERTGDAMQVASDAYSQEQKAFAELQKAQEKLVQERSNVLSRISAMSKLANSTRVFSRYVDAREDFRQAMFAIYKKDTKTARILVDNTPFVYLAEVDQGIEKVYMAPAAEARQETLRAISLFKHLESYLKEISESPEMSQDKSSATALDASIRRLETSSEIKLDRLFQIPAEANRVEKHFYQKSHNPVFVVNFDDLRIFEERLYKLLALASQYHHASSNAQIALDKALTAILQVDKMNDSAGMHGADHYSSSDADKLAAALYEASSAISKLGDLKLRGASTELDSLKSGIEGLLKAMSDARSALSIAELRRRPLDHKKFLDMLIDEMEDKYIELLEGTRAHTANIDNYIKRLTTALDDDFNTQFYLPAFRQARTASRFWDVNFAQLETTSILANNRAFAKVSPQATMEFDLPKRDILVTEAMKGAKAVIDDYGALVNDPSFLALSHMKSGNPTASGPGGTVRSVIPSLDANKQEFMLNQTSPSRSTFGASLEALIPDPAVYKFETGTGYEIRPVIQPDGQAVVFHFNYLYTTNVREPVRADEKHLGRVKQHAIDTDVQLSNFELREVSRYLVALKASRTARGVPLLEDVPLVGVLFRPLPQQESSLQQNVILAQSTIFPTLFDLMGLRWAPAVADVDPLRLVNEDFLVRNRRRMLMNRVFDVSSGKVDEFLHVEKENRRPDLYRSQETVPYEHPNGYTGPGLDYRDSQLKEGFQPGRLQPADQYVPGESIRRETLPALRGPEGTTVEPLRNNIPPMSQPRVTEELPAQAPLPPTNSGTSMRLQPVLPRSSPTPVPSEQAASTVMPIGSTLSRERPFPRAVPVTFVDQKALATKADSTREITPENSLGSKLRSALPWGRRANPAR